MFAVCKAISVASSVAAPASSTNENATCVVANTRKRRLMPGVMRRLPLARPNPVGACADGSFGTYASRTAAAIASATPTQSKLESTVTSSARIEKRAAKRATIDDHRPRQQHAEHGAGAAQHEALRQQRSPQRTAAGAERGANGELAFATHRAREDQVRDVRARDDEHHRRGGEQDQQDRPRRRRDLIAKAVTPKRMSARAGYDSGCSLIMPGVNRDELGARPPPWSRRA